MIDDDRLCPDCKVTPGTKHQLGCDVARCLYGGSQRLNCSAPRDHDCGWDKWTGEMPGELECREFGWYARMHPVAGWTPCAPDAPNARPDHNRLQREAQWSREHVRWVRW